MVNYRRDLTPGGVYFFTVTLQDRQSDVLIAYIKNLGQAFRAAKNKADYKMLAFVILPDHLHVIWQLPPDDFNYSYRWHLIKRYFTRALIRDGLVLHPNKRGEYNLWQRRFWEHRIRNQRDYENHVNYIHYNPVKHGIVAHPNEWHYSSIHRFIAQNIIGQHWSGESANSI